MRMLWLPLLMALAYGVPAEVISSTAKSFLAVEHRIEYVTEKHGVVYYNDSKGTNPDAAIKGIQAMDRPTLLIGGGYDKDSSYTEWIESFDGQGKIPCTDRTDKGKDRKGSKRLRIY